MGSALVQATEVAWELELASESVLVLESRLGWTALMFPRTKYLRILRKHS